MKKDKTLKDFIISILSPILLIVVWETFSRLGYINESLLPSFSTVIQTITTLLKKGTLQENIMVSLIRVSQGFLLGSLLGILIGMLMGFIKPLDRFLRPLVGLLRPVPMIAWIPLLILWLGIGEESKITLITVGAFWSVLLNTISGIQSVDGKLLEVSKILKKSKFETVFKVILPSALPSMFTGIRLGMGASWSCVVAAEMIASSKGIGFMITYARQVSKPDEVLVGIIVIGLIGFLIDAIILKIERRLLRWYYQS